MRTIIILVILAVFMQLSAQTEYSVYYFDANASSGGSGSILQPYDNLDDIRTIAAARPVNVIMHFKAGVYDIDSSFSSPMTGYGQGHKNIIIQADEPGVIFKSTDSKGNRYLFGTVEDLTIRGVVFDYIAGGGCSIYKAAEDGGSVSFIGCTFANQSDLTTVTGAVGKKTTATFYDCAFEDNSGRILVLGNIEATFNHCIIEMTANTVPIYSLPGSLSEMNIFNSIVKTARVVTSGYSLGDHEFKNSIYNDITDSGSFTWLNCSVESPTLYFNSTDYYYSVVAVGLEKYSGDGLPLGVLRNSVNVIGEK